MCHGQREKRWSFIRYILFKSIIVWGFEDLEKGAYGILEPKKEFPVYEAGEGQTTLAILPGSVFDEKKNRVGYGGGFYDRYFEKRKDICRIAAAYEMQIVEEIETEEFDLPADYVITEERFWQKFRKCIIESFD